MNLDSLIHALTYISKCPMCLSGMAVDNDTNSYCRLINEELLNESRDWFVKISIDEKNISITETRQVGFMDPDFTGPPRYPRESSPPVAHILGTQVSCSNDKCLSYSYVFSFRVDSNKSLISNITLNTEYMIFDKNGINYEIINSHSVQKTRYKVSDPNPCKEVKTLELPFIPFNYSNPSKTLEKVKNLIIFT